MKSTLKRPERGQRLTVESLNLPNNDVKVLKRFFKIGRDDEKRIGSLAEASRGYAKKMIEKFYDHVLSEPDAAKFFPDQASIDRAKRAQGVYFEQMTSGDYGEDYLETRLQVGVMHNSIDLPPKWYIGGFAAYLDNLAEEFNTVIKDPEERYSALKSFAKLILMDMSVVMEAFIVCRQEQLAKEQEAVKRAEEMNRGVLNAATTIGIYAISKEGIIQSWNKGAEHVTGYTAEEAIGKDFRMFYPKEELDRGQVDYEMREASSKGSVQAAGIRLAKGGRPFFARASLSPLLNSDGQLIGYVKIVQDETQLNREREAVRNAEEMNRGVLNAANSIGIYAISREGIIQTWNKGAEHVTGYTAEEAIGKDFRMFYAKEDLDAGQVDYEMREASNRGAVQAEGWRLAKGNRAFFAKASLSPLVDGEGKPIGFVKIVQDETERKKIEDRLALQRKEMSELVKVIGGVSAQVSSVSTQLSSSTAQTVAAISETTATAEEVKQTADQTSLKAKNVSDDAKDVVQVSKQGQQATDATVNGMVRIREQMDSIAECMVQLSNQSKLIGDIIATVDDLAQQSNLLAVNASIEAAKAGEQGKGFAVVAQEVKNLSQQSKGATAHVRSILNDIVKATTAATMATEQGGKAVEVGHQQASDAGSVIKTLSGSIEKAAQATELIEVSSQQQLIGMRQMVEAMESIKTASEQNLQSANQLESTGRELSDLGRRLLELTNQT